MQFPHLRPLHLQLPPHPGQLRVLQRPRQHPEGLCGMGGGLRGPKQRWGCVESGRRAGRERVREGEREKGREGGRGSATGAGPLAAGTRGLVRLGGESQAAGPGARDEVVVVVVVVGVIVPASSDMVRLRRQAVTRLAAGARLSTSATSSAAAWPQASAAAAAGGLPGAGTARPPMHLQIQMARHRAAGTGPKGGGYTIPSGPTPAPPSPWCTRPPARPPARRTSGAFRRTVCQISYRHHILVSTMPPRSSTCARRDGEGWMRGKSKRKPIPWTTPWMGKGGALTSKGSEVRRRETHTRHKQSSEGWTHTPA